MGLEIGYDQEEKGGKLYLKYPWKKYHYYLSKLTNQIHPNEKCLIQLYSLNSSLGNKYAIKLKNFLFYKFFNQKELTHFNLELSKKRKIIQSINFDINPNFKLSMDNLLKVKYGKYEAGINQIFFNRNKNKEGEINNYDFSSVFPSMIPRKRLGITFNKTFPFFSHSFFQMKTTFNKIFSYENNVKFIHRIKSYFNIPTSYFNLLINNELCFKESFCFGRDDEEKNFGYHHILSYFRPRSKIIEMNIPNHENEISPGENFYIQNFSSFRFCDLPFFNKFEITKKFSPHFNFETFCFPSNPFKSMFKYIYSFGMSFKLQDNFFLDFSIYSGASHNIPIKKKYINSFRIKIGN
jgi:hypothetical protein